MAISNFATFRKKILLAAMLLSLVSILFGAKHAAALGDNFPQGHSNYNEWVLLSQYQCPGHCLDTPNADIRIFYSNYWLDQQGVGNNDSLQVYTQVDCRYVGTPNGSASLSGGTNRPGWPGLNCTGLNTSSGGSELSTFTVKRGNLNCSESGNTQKYPGWCYADLNLSVANAPGNQPIVGVWINTGDGLGRVRITAQEESNPSQNYTNVDCYTGAGGTCAVPGSANLAPKSHLFTLWNNYANNGPDTHHNWDLSFGPDCTVTSNKTVYLRWYDADDGGSGNNGTQSGQISFDLHDDTANSYIFNNRAGLGGNDSYRDVGFTIKPGHKYTWAWNNVSATNGIQLWIPYSEINGLIDCPPTTGNPPPPGQNPVAGTVSCSASVDNSNPFLGQAVTITVTVTNESNATDWWIGTNNTNFGYSNNPSSANYPPSPPDITQPPYVANNYLHYYPHTNAAYPDVVNDGKWITKEHSVVFLETGQSNALNAPQNTSRLGKGQTSFPHAYAVSNSDPNVPVTTYHFGVRNDETGAYFPTSNGNSVCDVSVTWQRVSLSQYGCSTTSVYNPGNLSYYLVFTDSAGNLVHNTGFDPGAPFTGTRNFNTFVDFPYLYPHGSYNIYIYQWGSNAPLDDPVVVQGCMAASCQTSFSADLEPGQSGNVTYGVYLANYTGRTYNSNEYGVSVDTSPGLYGSGSTPIVFASNANLTAYNVTFGMRADYGGSITAHVLFGGGVIDGAIPYTPCSPTYNPESRPTLKVTNGDISTGGGYEYKTTNADGDVIYQCPTLTSAFTNGTKRYISPANGNNNSGGIRTFANPSTLTGSGADFAAYALGYINGASGGPNGFYSAAKTTGSPGYNYLMFANTTGNTNPLLGGLLGGQVAANHCTTDYFDKTGTKALGDMADPGNIIAVDGLASGQYYHNGDVTLTGGIVANGGARTIARGHNVTLYIDGDVNLSVDILYDNWQIDTTNYTNNAPYFTLVVKGNIYVNKAQTILNGLYIAQPKDDGSGGAFVSCSEPTATTPFARIPTPSEVGNDCKAPLTVKGSVIAQHVYPVRASGTLFNNTGTSETFDYLPSMAVGQPNLVPICGGAAVKQCEDVTSNLPPVF